MLGECCLPLGTGDDACSVKGSRFFRGPFCVLTEFEIPMISSSVKARAKATRSGNSLRLEGLGATICLSA